MGAISEGLARLLRLISDGFLWTIDAFSYLFVWFWMAVLRMVDAILSWVLTVFSWILFGLLSIASTVARSLIGLLPEMPDFGTVGGVGATFVFANRYVPVAESLVLIGFLIGIYMSILSYRLLLFIRKVFF